MKQFINFLLSFLTKTTKSTPTHINKIDDSTTNQPTITGIGKVVTMPDVVKNIKSIKEIKAMYKFGKRSKQRLDTCHPDMIKIMEEVIKIYDFSVLEGLRTAEKQMEYFETGRSKLDGVNKLSKHQDHGDGLSYAIDIMPYKKGSNAFSGKQKDIARFYYLGGLVKMAAFRLLEEGKITHTIRWGADWNSNDLFDDQNFDDLPHFELKKV